MLLCENRKNFPWLWFCLYVIEKVYYKKRTCWISGIFNSPSRGCTDKSWSSSTFPTVAKMARNVFSVTATSVLAERVFYKGSNIVDKNRRKLSESNTRSYVCMKNWMKWACVKHRFVKSIFELQFCLIGLLVKNFTYHLIKYYRTNYIYSKIRIQIWSLLCINNVNKIFIFYSKIFFPLLIYLF